MVTVYLDQCAVSCLARADSMAEWRAILDKLTAGFSAGRIVCPMPVETLIESAPCETQLRIAIDDLFHGLSNGERFPNIWELLLDETLRLARPSHVIYPFRAMGAGWGKLEEAARIATEAHAEGREQMRQRFEAHAPCPRADGRSLKEIFRDGIQGRCGMFFRDLQKFGSDPTTPVSDYECSGLMKGLIRHGFTATEASKIKEAVLFHKWEKISINRLDLFLGSVWDHDLSSGRRYRANDEIDRWRSVVALCYSDLFITDGYMARLCQRAGVANHTTTKVYSVGQTGEILQFLE